MAKSSKGIYGSSGGKGMAPKSIAAGVEANSSGNGPVIVAKGPSKPPAKGCK